MIQDLTPKQRRDLPGSIVKSLLAMSHGKPAVELAREVSDTIGAAGNGLAFEDRSLFVPLDMLRTLSTTVFTAGGALSDDTLGAPEPVLRSASVLERAGTVVIPGLRGNIQIPRETIASTISWYHELDTATESDPIFGALSLVPKRATGACTLSRQLETMSGQVATAFLLESLSIGVAKALDAAGLAGIGAAGQPTGIPLVAGVGSVTFSAAATWTNVLDLEKTALTGNAIDENIVFIGHPDVKKKWRTIQRFTGSDLTLWQPDNNTIAGHPALVTTAASATGIIAGDFTQARIGIFGPGVQLIVDPYSASLEHKIAIVVNLMADFGVLRPAAFVINSGSVVQ